MAAKAIRNSFIGETSFVVGPAPHGLCWFSYIITDERKLKLFDISEILGGYMVEECLERRQFLFRLLLTLEEKRERRSVKYRLFNIERRILPKRQGNGVALY